jgi:hypothetical protein
MLSGASTRTTGTSGQRSTPTHSTVTAVIVRGSGPGETAPDAAEPGGEGQPDHDSGDAVEHRMQHGSLAEPGIDRADREHDRERAGEEAEQRQSGARTAAQMPADQDAQLDPVGAGHDLAQRHRGEKGLVVDPAPLHHHLAMEPAGAAAAEAGAAEPEERPEDPPEANGGGGLVTSLGQRDGFLGHGPDLAAAFIPIMAGPGNARRERKPRSVPPASARRLQANDCTAITATVGRKA